jgi:hypothetical protein
MAGFVCVRRGLFGVKICPTARENAEDDLLIFVSEYVEKCHLKERKWQKLVNF